MLKNAFDTVNAATPMFSYVCTQKYALDLNLPQKLEEIVKTYNIDYEPHNALSDA